jgi:glycine/D-amino acid oxidase-like deaminating enzyme
VTSAAAGNRQSVHHNSPVTITADAPSWWLASLAQRPRRPPLTHGGEADVCIVGAGMTGLWAAYELKRAAPELSVVILEAEQVGFGASGRNGGWLVGELAGAERRWVARAGMSAWREQVHAIQASVTEVARTVQRERIDCDLRHGGVLRVARGGAQEMRLREQFAHERELRLDPQALLLDKRETRERIAVRGAGASWWSPHAAAVQPAKLVRGLADAALALGVELYESTRVAAIGPGRARTTSGHTITARHVVRATEGYTAHLRGQRRALLPMNSSMIVTAPLDDQAWAQIGWAGAETLSDEAHVFVYLQRTADGRIAIGGRGVPYRFGSRTDREGPVPARTVHELHARLVEMFPPARGVAIDAAWHGVLGVARDWLPSVGLDRRSGLAWAGGYAGEGVAATNLAARTLRDLLLGRDSALTRLPWVGPPARAWEPEPLRWLGARLVYGLYRRADQRESASDSAATDPLARLAGLISGR